MVTEYSPPVPGPAAARIHGFSRYLPESGWVPIVVTPSSPRTVGLGPAHASPTGDPRSDAHSNARLISVSRSLPRWLSTVLDQLHLTAGRLPSWPRVPVPDGWTVDWFWSALLAVSRAAARERVALVYATAPPVTGLFATAVAAGVLRLPLVLDFRDLWCDNPGYNAPRALAAFHRRCERWLLRRAARVVVNTPGARRVLHRQHRRVPELDSKLCVIPNGFDSQEVPRRAREEGRGDRREPLRLCFVGKLYGDFGVNSWDAAFVHRRRLVGWSPPPATDVLPPALACLSPVGLFEAVRDLVDAGDLAPGDLVIDFIGNFGDGNARLARALGLGSIIRFYPTVDPVSALAAIHSADALLLISSDAGHVVPAKTYEYLGAGKPLLVVAPAGDLEQLLRSSGVQWFGARPDDTGSIRAALIALLDALRSGLPTRTARPAFLARYERRHQAGQLARLFDEVGGGLP